MYVGSFDGYLYAINPDGTLHWRFQTGDGIFPSPAVALDGTVLFGSNDGYIYAVCGSAPLADSPWPKVRHDNLNTGRVGAGR